MALRKRVVKDSSDEGSGASDAEQLDSDARNASQDVDDDIDEEEDDDDRDEEDEDEEEEDEDEDEDEDEEEDEEEGGYPTEDAPRMTARQRNRQNGTSSNFGQIDIAELEGYNRPKRNILSAEEQRIKRAELARRRRNQSQQRLEEKKKETLDKLLKKRAKKMRGDEIDIKKSVRSRLHPPHPALTSWVSTKKSVTLSMTLDRAEFEKL